MIKKKPMKGEIVTEWSFTFESSPAGASISIHQIVTGSSILARIWPTLIFLYFTVHSSPTWVTETHVPEREQHISVLFQSASIHKSRQVDNLRGKKWLLL